MSFFPWPTPLDYSKQSVEVQGTKKKGQTAHYRNGVWGLVDLDPCISTLPQVFDIGFSRSRNLPYLGHRPLLSSPGDPPVYADYYVWQTYAEVDVRRRAVGSAICELFRKGKLSSGEEGMDVVGIWSRNRPEWQIIDMALHAYKKVGVSLYDTLGKDSVEYIINHASLPIIFASSSHIPTLLKLLPRTPTLKMIVSIDDLSPDIKDMLQGFAETLGVEVMELSTLEIEGRKNMIEPIPVTKNDVACICYTSGTTSTPKGAILTHGNLAAVAQTNLHGNSFPGEKGRMFSYLPLAHIYERICQHFTTATGGCIGFSTNDPLTLLTDAQILKPNFFPSVPRVLNRIYQAAMVVAKDEGMRGRLFRTAMRKKIETMKETGENVNLMWDFLVFRKIQAVLGGHVSLITCGSAPIAPDVMDFLKIGLSCEVVEGYGMTENCGTCLRVWPNDPASSGTVGAPQPCNEVKLVDVPEMGYTAEDKPRPRGEICVRGTNCFNTYFKDEKNTRETVDEDGWLHTGDVGEIDECGRFKIIDRAKNIMKLVWCGPLLRTTCIRLLFFTYFEYIRG